MNYNLSDKLDIERFTRRVDYLIGKGAIVEMTEKAYRSGNQNRYLHALLGALAIETGNTLEYVKVHYYKKMINPEIFLLARKDRFLGEVEVLRSSADLTIEEMSSSIERLKKWAAEEGIYLPEPGDEELLSRIEYEMGRLRNYL